LETRKQLCLYCFYFLRIIKIGADKIANVPAPSFESALAGKAAGVQITTSNGLAGSGAVIRIRGISTVNTQADPLFVIDGLPINIEGGILGGPTRNTVAQDRNPLANINPNGLENFILFIFIIKNK